MNRTEIIERLRDFPYGRKDYWVVAGGAMVIHGIREETSDIDLGCTSSMADRLEAEGIPFAVTADGSRRFRIGSDIEVFENWLYDKVILSDGIPVISVHGLLTMKQHLGRDKDRRDIALISQYVRRQTAKEENA